MWELVDHAISTGHINKGLAETLIVPIPMVDNPITFRDFRPINLCNVLLKVVSKVIVNRVGPFLDNIIGSLQSSFIPGRSTSVSAIIA